MKRDSVARMTGYNIVRAAGLRSVPMAELKQLLNAGLD